MKAQIFTCFATLLVSEKGTNPFPKAEISSQKYHHRTKNLPEQLLLHFSFSLLHNIMNLLICKNLRTYKYLERLTCFYLYKKRSLIWRQFFSNRVQMHKCWCCLYTYMLVKEIPLTQCCIFFSSSLIISVFICCYFPLLFFLLCCFRWLLFLERTQIKMFLDPFGSTMFVCNKVSLFYFIFFIKLDFRIF